MSENVAVLSTRLSAVNDMLGRVQHVHGLVEQFAVAAQRGSVEPHVVPLRRAFAQLKREFTGAGMDSLAQLAGSMEMAAGRSGMPLQRVRILRDGVASMRHQLEVEQRSIQRSLAEARADQ